MQRLIIIVLSLLKFVYPYGWCAVWQGVNNEV